MLEHAIRDNLLAILDDALASAGAVLLAVVTIRHLRQGWHDPLRGSPRRANRLTALWIWVVLATYALAGIAGAGVAVRLAPPDLSESTLRLWQGIFASNVMQIAVAVAALAVAARTFRRGWSGIGLGRRPWPADLIDALKATLVALFLCGAIARLTEWVFRLLHFALEPHGVFQLLEDPSVTPTMQAFTVLGVMLLAPISEELLFRGILQTGLQRLLRAKWGTLRHRWLAVAITATVFGLMHSTTPQHVPALIVFGLMLGFLYERTGSLMLPILIHMMFNAKSLLWTAWAGG